MYRSILFSITLTLLLAFFIFDCSSEDKQANENASSEINFASGSIQGRVVYAGEAPRVQRLMVVKDTDVCGQSEQYDKRLVICEDNGIQNAVIYLTGVKGGKPLSSLGNEFILDQQGCRYEPHVLIVPVNTPLQILNSDNILHNFHTFCEKNRPCNISQPKFRKKMEIDFEHPEFVQARCDIHGWMSCWIVVVDHPYYAITDADGNFYLSDVPPGTYTLNCWQEKLGEQTIQVTVAQGSIMSSSFTFTNKGA